MFFFFFSNGIKTTKTILHIVICTMAERLQSYTRLLRHSSIKPADIHYSAVVNRQKYNTIGFFKSLYADMDVTVCRNRVIDVKAFQF